MFKKNQAVIALLSASFALFLLCFVFLIFFNPYPLKYEQEILLYCEKYQVPAPLVASIINAESSFDASAKSAKGASGLMQVLPSTAKWICQTNGLNFAKDDLFVAEKNIQIGTLYLAYLLAKFPDVKTAVAAYNAGEGNVMLWLASKTYSDDAQTLLCTPFPATNAYVEKVINGLKIYNKKIN